MISLRSSRQNRCPDFQPICRELHAPARFAKGRIGKARGLCEGIAGTCRQGLCGAHAFGFGRFGRSSETPGTRAARRGAACGRYRGNPMRNAGWLIAGFFAAPEPRFFSEPGFWSRRDALRRPERGAGLATRGASAGLAGLAGSAVRVILQDWQDRWNVAQIGDIPETGDPRCQNHMPAPHAPSVPDTCR